MGRMALKPAKTRAVPAVHADPVVPPHRDGVVPLHRLEAFSDAVFAFAVTLLVVSLEVPKSAPELFAAMRGFVAFGICFLFLAMIWVEHSRFFQRFPLTDALTVALNMLLLFVVLLYVYPLKFLFAALTDGLWAQPSVSIDSVAQVRSLMIVYGIGFLTVNLVLVAMRLNAPRQMRRRAPGDFGALERLALQTGLLRNMAQALVAVGSIMIVALTRDDGFYAGMIYILLAPIGTLVGLQHRRQLRRLAGA